MLLIKTVYSTNGCHFHTLRRVIKCTMQRTQPYQSRPNLLREHTSSLHNIFVMAWSQGIMLDAT